MESHARKNNRLVTALTPENLVEEMISTEQKWKIIHMFRRIMKTKKDQEKRVRQADELHFPNSQYKC